MKYSPGKLLQLLGFVDAEPLRRDQRFLILKDPQVGALPPCTPSCTPCQLARTQT